MTDATAVLDVEKSLGGKRWLAKPVDERSAMMVAQRTGVPDVVARLLVSRGISMDTMDDFLNPSLKALLPDPHVLRDMEIAAERLASAVMQNELIAVFGDYDVDGATSSAVLSRFFAAVGGRTRVYIPDRLKEGYGPNADALLKLRDEGASVVVTVDCGTAAFDPLAAAGEAGLDVVVVDHHEAEATLPRAIAVVNPNRMDEDDDVSERFGTLAAVGVAFLVIVAVNRALRQAGWFTDQGRPEPNLLGLLDLVALGTVCDVVPLVGLNRAFVSQGLKVMAKRANRGLATLADVAGVDSAPGTYHAGFLLGPRINAGGRVGTPGLGATLLTTNDAMEAQQVADKLHALNKERQEIEAAVLAAALDQVEQQGAGNVVIAAGEGWHPGVIGIVASRLKEKYNRPSCVVAVNDGEGVGSARSVSGVDLGAAVIAARQAGLLIKGGGHKMAAGFTVAADRLDALRAFLNDRVADELDARGPVPTLYVDGHVSVAGATQDLAQAIERVGPFGAGNPEPRFVMAEARVTGAAVVGNGHVRCTLGGSSGGRVGAIAFRAMDSDLGPALLNADGRAFHVVGKVRLDTWQGRTSVKVHIEDAQPVW